MKTYSDVYQGACRRLRAEGVPMPELEARLMLSYITGRSQAELLRDIGRAAGQGAAEGMEAMISRRINAEPLAYILGEWEFYGLPLKITPDTLIPRDDTEALAGAAIEALKGYGGQCRALDLCAGSGCVGLAIAARVPGCRVTLAELSPGALEICRENIRRNGLDGSASAVRADACEPPPELSGFDVIACNPPYIPAGEIAGLERSVRDFEPRLALDGGEDGLRFYRLIADMWRGALNTGGTMMFECGAGQAGDVRVIMEANGFTDITTIRDLRGAERVVTGRIGG